MNLSNTTQLANLGSFRPPSSRWGTNTTDAQVTTNLENFLSTVIGFLTIIASIYFVVNFLIAGVSWVTASGDAGKIQSARDRMIQSTIGLVVIVGAYAIIGLIGTVLGLDLLRPAEVILDIAS